MIEGKGAALLVYVPNIRQHNIDEKGVLQLKWEFEEAGNEQISGFTLNKSLKSDGPYTQELENIAPGQRSLSYDQLDAANYFTITAIAKNGESRSSYPVLVQAIDSVPPAVPSGLTAIVDTTGKVNLKWIANTEKDILGYKIFRALNKNEEAVPLVDSVWQVNSYQDILSLKLTNKKAWYGISAIDQRFNQSAISELVELKKPSVIPPSAAVISRFKTDGSKITLNWINSEDQDIISHSLFKRLKPDSIWILVKTFPGEISETYKENLKADQEYDM